MSRISKLTSFGVYFMLWIMLTFFLLFLYYDKKMPLIMQFIPTLLITCLTSLPAFYSSKVLVPRYLYPKKIRMFIVVMIIVALANTMLTYLIAGGTYSLLGGRPIFYSLEHILYISSYILVVNVIVIGVSSAIQIISDRFGMEIQLHEVESEKIITELAYLRAQINPHFLFNVLNTIYFQIHKENAEAKNSVEKFSEMLRYQLYECNTDLIDISKELAYIENYVAIQQLRMEPGTDLQISVTENIGSFKIAPLLILPLIENAFKFISNHKDPSKNKLYISISIEERPLLVVNVMNTYYILDNTNQLINSSGVGLKNMKRRLALLYPDKYSLTKKQTENTYETTLKIQLQN